MLSKTFRSAGGGFIPDIVNATREAEVIQGANVDFLTRANAQFGTNPATPDVTQTADIT